MSEIIAKAMNSTLGTENFKGFDELMLDNKSIVPSSDILVEFNPGSYFDATSDDSETLEAVKFTMPLNGSFFLRYDFKAVNNSYDALMKIYINDEEYYSLSTRTTGLNTSGTYRFITANRGDIIKITMYSTDGAKGRFWGLYGKLLDMPGINLTLST